MLYHWNTILILMKCRMYHWNPNGNFGVPLESYTNVWCTAGILCKFMVYHCTTELEFMDYHWNPKTIYSVSMESHGHLWYTFAPFWNPKSKSRAKKNLGKTRPRKGEKEKRIRSSSLPSTSAKGSCVEKNYENED